MNDILRVSTAIVALVCLLAGPMTVPAPAADTQTVDVPVILPLTGPAAGIGQELQKSLGVAEHYVNDTGGIRKVPLHFDFLDDQGQPQVAAQIIAQLKSQNHPVIIGAALSALCKSMLSLVADQGPVLYCLTPAVVPPAGGYVFAISAPSQFELLTAFRYFRDHGMTKLAFLTSTDASGAEADQSIKRGLALPEYRALVDVVHEHYNPGDISMAGQLSRIKAAAPQAIFLFGSPVVLGNALHGVSDAGLDVPVVVSQSMMSFNSMDQLSAYLPKQLLFASSFWNAASVLPDGPQRRQLITVQQLFHSAGIPLDIFQILPWDAAMIVANALRTAGPTASPAAIRMQIADLHDYWGVDGAYDFRTGDQRGLGANDVLMYQWIKDRRDWQPVSLGAGAALKR
jgi:branched-chain amino acid transport system substrate-binding protein